MKKLLVIISLIALSMSSNAAIRGGAGLSKIEGMLGDYVLKAGDTMTGTLTMDAGVIRSNVADIPTVEGFSFRTNNTLSSADAYVFSIYNGPTCNGKINENGGWFLGELVSNHDLGTLDVVNNGDLVVSQFEANNCSYFDGITRFYKQLLGIATFQPGDDDVLSFYLNCYSTNEANAIYKAEYHQAILGRTEGGQATGFLAEMHPFVDDTGGEYVAFRAADIGTGEGSATKTAFRVDDYWDNAFIAASGKVGIGTTEPGSLLTVAGTIESTTGKFTSDVADAVSAEAFEFRPNNTISSSYAAVASIYGNATTTEAIIQFYEGDIVGLGVDFRGFQIPAYNGSINMIMGIGDAGEGSNAYIGDPVAGQSLQFIHDGSMRIVTDNGTIEMQSTYPMLWDLTTLECTGAFLDIKTTSNGDLRFIPDGSGDIVFGNNQLVSELHTDTSGNIWSLKASPESASTAGILVVEADGENWGVGARALKIVSDDDDCYALSVNDGTSTKMYIHRNGSISTVGNITLAGAGGGTIQTSAGDLILQPSSTTTEVQNLRVTGTIEGGSPVKIVGGLDLQTGGFFVGSGSITASAVVQMDSTTQGFLPPRMTTTQIDAINSPVDGLLVYDTDSKLLSTYNSSSPGWKEIACSDTIQSSWESSTTETTTSLAAYQDKVSVTFTPEVAGNYEVHWSCELKNVNDKKGSIARLYDVTSTTEVQYSYHNATNQIDKYAIKSGTVVRNISEATNYKIQFADEDGSGTAGIRRAYIIIKKL